MNFNWIKKLFKINSNNKGDSFGISTIDTSFIKVPKLSDLSKENQDKVMEYFNEIKYDNYETIVKYSDSLLEKSNREIDFFVHDLEDSIKNISAILKEVNKNNYFKLLLCREEIKLSIEELNKIKQEAELRLIALDTYIKKEERRKYDFLGIFGKAERLRYLSDKSSLLNERQRLLITIKLNKKHLQIIYNSLNENKDLLEQMEIYFANSNSFNTMYCDARFSMVYAGELLWLKRLINKNDCYELEQLVKNSTKYSRIIITRRLLEIGIEEFDKIHESLKYQEVIHLLAHEDRGIKQYAYEHRNDYKLLIDEMNTITNTYEKMPSNKWNIDILNEKIKKYIELIDNYVIICKRYVSNDILKQIIKTLYNLNYLVYITKGITIGSNHPKPNIIFSIRDLKQRSDETEYYKQKAIELIRKIESKYNIKLTFHIVDYLNKDYELQKSVIAMDDECELRYLYDIFNGYFENFDLGIIVNNFDNYKNKTTEQEMVQKLSDFIKQITSDRIQNDDTYCINSGSFMSLDDLLYLLKFLGIKKYNLRSIYMDQMYFGKHRIATSNNSKICAETNILIELLSKCYLSKLEQEYDDRIFVIPKEIEFHQLLEYQFKHVRNSLENLIINENTIAILVTNWGQVNTIHRALEKNEFNIKYFIMTENLYKSYKEVYETRDDEIEQKIIVVPDDVKYIELSIYLDRELEKEKSEEKVLSKTI